MLRSLENALLAWLLPPLVIVGGVAAGGAYVFMERHLTAAYDQDLGDIARALVPYLRMHKGVVALVLSEQAEAVLRADSSAQIYYAVTDTAGSLVAGDSALPSPPVMHDGAPTFWDDARDNQSIRAVALLTHVDGIPVTVTAAETRTKRDSAARGALLSAIAPVTLLTIAAGAALVFGVRRGLSPLERLREELQERSHTRMNPLDEENIVEELKPLVHELNDMLGRLKLAQDTQARFIANAAHQLRTPIAGLVTQIDLAATGPEACEHLAHAREAAGRLARLAQQVLSLAAADPLSNPSGSAEPCDLAEIVRSRADTWLRAARDVELEFDLRPAKVRGEAILIGELAANLVDNACRYGGHVVHIATRLDRQRALLEVEDDGPGIPASQRPRIFERFHRLDNQSTDGSGLGLAIVAEIAQRHRATIEVRDATLHSHGTCVRVSFPALETA
jgi:two-component system, OmpR family, sensor histidine kinase TctE